MEEERKWSIGIIGGPQYARAYNLSDTFVNGSGLHDNYSQKERLYFAGYVGVNVQLYFKNYLTLRADFLYSQQGEIYKPGIDHSAIEYVHTSYKRNFYYLKLPLMLGCNLPLNGVNLKLCFGAHVNFLAAYSEKQTSDIFWGGTRIKALSLFKDGTSKAYYSISHNNTPIQDPLSLPPVSALSFKPWPYKRVTWGIDYSIALGIRLAERWELNIEARGDYEFIDNQNRNSKVIDDAYNTTLDVYSANRSITHNLTASFGVGVSYLFLKR